MRNELTIYDIAKALNIPASSIRRALANSGISHEQTMSKVASVSVPLIEGRTSLHSSISTPQKRHVLGSLVTHLNSTIPSCVLSGAEAAAAEMGYSLMMHQSMNNPEVRCSNLDSLINHHVDGVLVTSAYFQESESLEQLTSLNIPVVAVEASALLPGRPRKKVSDLQNACELTEYLIEKGCRQIAYVSTDLNSPRHKNLLAGCREAALRNKLPEPETLVSNYDDEQNFWASINHLLLSAKSRPDGVLFSNNTVTALAFAPPGASATRDQFFITWRKGSMSSQNRVLVEIGKLAATLLIYLSERMSKSSLKLKAL